MYVLNHIFLSMENVSYLVNIIHVAFQISDERDHSAANHLAIHFRGMITAALVIVKRMEIP